MPFSNKIAKLTFASAAFILFILSYTLYIQINDLDDAYDKVNQTNVVKLKLEQALSTVKDAETAQRGFLLTQDSFFLKPYYGAYEKVRTLISEIRGLTSANAQQQKNLNALSTFIEVRFKTFDIQIRQYNLPETNLATRRLHLLTSQSSTDSIRYHIQSITDQEDQLLASREQRKTRHRYMTPFLAFLLIISALTMLIFSYDKITEQLKKTKKLLFQLRSLNNKLKRKNHELEMYNKELDSFTYIASHDLKEPLRKILTFTSMIGESDHEKLSPKSRENIERILHSARRMQNLLNDLLLYSHTSLMDNEFEEVKLNTILDEVQFSLKEEIDDNRATILVGKLPQIKGLSFQLKQLFENLITNSLKYRRTDIAPLITIEADFIAREDVAIGPYAESSFYHRLVYTDNGIGFNQVYAEKIFELFKRVHTKNGQSGNGIGLTICKKIIQNHNGFISARSEVNQGASFEIYLPYEEVTNYKTKETPFSM